jgi:hypothetical protein
MVEVFVSFDCGNNLRKENDAIIGKDNSLLLSRNYYIDIPRKYFFNPGFFSNELIKRSYSKFQINNEAY